ncbi:MAG: hypothetical protein AB8H47_03190 [Bacteroidia bacterium]
MRQKQAARFLTQKSGEDTLRYQLMLVYDPYKDKPVMMNQPQNTSFLDLYTSGAFNEYDSINQSSGLWFINKPQDRLKLVYQIENGDSVPVARQDTSFRYQLVKLSNDSLVIGKQGRHGIVQYTYLLQIDTTQFDTTQISSPIDSLQQQDTLTTKRTVPKNPMAAGQNSLDRPAANQLIFDSLAYDTCSWRLFSTYDPYQDMLPAGERLDSSKVFNANPTYLRFIRNGEFVRFDDNGYNTGLWDMSADEPGRMRFSYTLQNGVKVSALNQDKYYRFQLQKRTQDTLIIAQQGRHGMVRSTYLYCPNDSIPSYQPK